MKKIKVIQACWLNDKDKHIPWCEYCSNNQSNNTYLPFHSSVLNPEHICENCAKNKTENLPWEFEIVDFFEEENEYRKELYKLKGQQNED